MLYLVFTTGRCNLSCKYCGGSFPRDLVPWEVKYDIKELKSFLEEDPEPSIAFYGGEPLLNARFIVKVLQEIEAKHFIMQTNGLLVPKLEPKLWRIFDTILLSIDGRKEITDTYRGKGVYNAVLRAARYLRKCGFKGDLIARMTITEDSDIYLDVTHLLELGLFNHVHWQLNVVWSPPWKDFKKWLTESYEPGISKLSKLWIENFKSGTVLGIAPFLGILKRIWMNGTSPPCGAGVNSFAILTNGKIIACPIAVDAKWAYLGHISTHSPKELPGKVSLEDPCPTCPLFKYCGGRCLYANRERYWNEEDFRLVCRATQSLINEVLKLKPKIEELVSKGLIQKKSLEYPKFNNTVEIVP